MSDLAARLLTLLPAETAHRAALRGLKAGFGPKATTEPDPVLRTAIGGIELPHPVGLAAGFFLCGGGRCHTASPARQPAAAPVPPA